MIFLEQTAKLCSKACFGVSLMKTQTVFSSRLMIFLSSMVLGCLVAIIVPSLFFNIFLLTFPQQILIIVGIWFCFGIIFYFFISWGINRFNVLSTLSIIDLSFQQMIRKIFLAIFFLFPVCLIVFQHFREFFQILIQGKVYDSIGWLAPQEGAGSFLIGVLTLGLFLFLMLLIVAGKPHLRQYLDDMPDYYYIIFILLAGISIRLFFIHLINTQPISDFAVINSDAILTSQGTRPEHMYVAEHVITTMIYGFLYTIFGPNLIVIKLFHIVLYALSGIFIYYAGKENFGNRLWAGIAGVLVVSWPSLALYSNVLTPEHLFIFVECALVFVISRFFKKQGISQSKIGVLREMFGFVVIGSLLGIMGMFRPFSQLFLIAFLITLFIYGSSFDLKRIILNITALLLSVWLLSNVPGIVASHYHNQFGNVRPCNLLFGMNIDALGRYNVEDTALCSKILSSTSNESVVTQKIMGIVFERLYTKQDYLLPFLDKKFAILWVNSNGIIYWALQLAKGDDPVFALDVAQKVNLVDFAMLLIATLACVTGAVLAFFKDVRPAIFFSLLSFFAFNLMEAFFEVQTRYRTVIMPLFIFFACWTFATIYSSTRKNGPVNWIMPNGEEGDGKTMVTKILKYKQILLSLFLGSVTSWLMKEKITPLLLGGRNFDARSELVKTGVLISLTVLTSLCFLCLIAIGSLFTRKFVSMFRK